MPPTGKPTPQEKQHDALQKTLQDVVDQLDEYPIDAFHFLQQGLSYSVEKFHGGVTDPSASRHISGQQLCEGLREFALLKWGMLARTVLRRWNITSTLDFGRIVFAMVDNGLMQKTEEDSVEDFRAVFDFRQAFECTYRIPADQLAAGNVKEGRQ
jgi:uncharacterized repeat protein (TIGR04138 family)